MTTKTADETFEGLRPLMFSIAYRMLGSAMEAEDMVQEAYLRYQSAKPENIQSPKGFLSTVVTRLSLDQLKSAKTKREEYVGEWLPEPILTSNSPSASAIIGERETISMAFMVLLESLSPVERAVFILREVFDYPYDEIAKILNKTEANCRQYYHRAKQYLVERRPRFTPTEDEQQRLLQVFTVATSTGDLDMLKQMLAESVTMTGDGGGKVAAARRPVVGRDAVARFLMGVVKVAPERASYGFTHINGQPAILLLVDGAIYGVMSFTISDGQIVAIHNVLNPDKLSHVKL